MFLVNINWKMPFCQFIILTCSMHMGNWWKWNAFATAEEHAKLNARPFGLSKCVQHGVLLSPFRSPFMSFFVSFPFVFFPFVLSSLCLLCGPHLGQRGFLSSWLCSVANKWTTILDLTKGYQRPAKGDYPRAQIAPRLQLANPCYLKYLEITSRVCRVSRVLAFARYSASMVALAKRMESHQPPWASMLQHLLIPKHKHCNTNMIQMHCISTPIRVNPMAQTKSRKLELAKEFLFLSLEYLGSIEPTNSLSWGIAQWDFHFFETSPRGRWGKMKRWDRWNHSSLLRSLIQCEFPFPSVRTHSFIVQRHMFKNQSI